MRYGVCSPEFQVNVMAASADSVSRDSLDSLSARYSRVREQSVRLAATLAPEDTVVQSMPDVSPTKWHLAHVTWFFERFVLESFVPGYRRLDEHYDYLFNSYYYTAGQMHARPRRGLLSRPTLAQVFDYRAHVDEHMLRLLEERDDDAELAVVDRQVDVREDGLVVEPLRYGTHGDSHLPVLQSYAT